MQEAPLKQDYQEIADSLVRLIRSKKDQPIVGSKVTLDFKQAELAILANASQAQPLLLNALVDLHQQAIKQSIPSSYSFFITQKCLGGKCAIEQVNSEAEEMGAGKCKYQQIRSYVKMREHLLSKVNQFTGSHIKALFEDIDDIRFLNFEIIGLVGKWKSQWKTEGQPEPVYYDCGMNYLLKINNDNVDMINLANFKKTKFVSPPNPFFLSEDGNLGGMSQGQKNQINECMQLIARERTVDLKMAVEGGPFVVQKQRQKAGGRRKEESRVVSSLINEAKNELQAGKEDEIKKIYKINKSLESTRYQIVKDKQEHHQQLRQNSNKQKEHEKLRMYQSTASVPKRSTSKPRRQAHPPKQPTRAVANPTNKSQVQPSHNSSNLRAEVDKRVKEMSRQRVESSKRQVKETKPKIRLVSEKQSVVEQTAHNILDFVTKTQSPTTQKRSTFYKNFESIREEGESMPKPLSQSAKRKSTSLVNFNLRRSISKPNIESFKTHRKIEEAPQLQNKPGEEQKSSKAEENISPKGIPAERVLKKSPKRQSRPSQSIQRETINQLSASKVQKGSSSLEEQTRNLNNEIKNMTIINIYKSTKQSSRRSKPLAASQVSPTAERPVHHSQENVASFVTEIPNRTEQSDKKEQLDHQLKSHKKKKQSELERLSNQVENSKHTVIQNEEMHKEYLVKKQQKEQELNQKKDSIKELEAKVKQLKLRKQQIGKTSKSKHTRKGTEFERQKRGREIQAKILRQKIKEEEMKLNQNHEKQLEMKEQSLKKEFKHSLKQLQVSNAKKKKEYESQLLSEQKKAKQSEVKVSKSRKECETVEQELEQKALKEALLKELVEEHERQVAKRLEEQERDAEEMELRLRRQIEEKEEMERDALRLMEEDRRQMQKVYDQLMTKNKAMEEENDSIAKQLQEIERRKKEEIDQLKKLQEDFQKSMVKAETADPSETEEKKEDIEDLRLKIKEELLKEIIEKKQKENELKKQEEERRQERLRKIEEEVAASLRQEEEKIQKENQEFLKKLEELKLKNLSVTDKIEAIERGQIPEPQLTGPANEEKESVSPQSKPKAAEQPVVYEMNAVQTAGPELVSMSSSHLVGLMPITMETKVKTEPSVVDNN